METLKGRRIVLAITGSVAAYKGAEILRALQKRGATVKVAMSRSAQEFISPLTFEVLSGFKVYKDIFGSGASVEHVSLAGWGELLLVAPATANTIAKISCGIADTPVSELALCFGRGIVAPAMNVRMYKNSITQENLARLRSFGWEIVEPESGELACGEEGEGRLAEVEKIAQACEYWFYPKELAGKKVVITAGATREYIDPVRFISNPSSGKMGFALAKVAAAMGADVVLISGATCLKTPYRVKKVSVESVDEMKEAVLEHAQDADIYISAAAIGDFRAKKRSEQKIKKKAGELLLELERTVDILELVGRRKKRGQMVVGFAAETQELLENAKKKLEKKNLDLIVANDVSGGKIFGSSQTKVKLITKEGEILEAEGSKEEVAKVIMQTLSSMLKRGGRS